MNQFRPTGKALAVRPAPAEAEVELAAPVLRSWDDMVATGFAPPPARDPGLETLRRVLQAEADAQDARRAALSAKD